MGTTEGSLHSDISGLSSGASRLDPSLNGFDDPEVDRMIRFAVSKVKRDFARYRDIDEESLFVDIKGDVWRGWKTFNRSLSKPGSHAFRVAYARLMDKRRAVRTRLHSAEQRDDGVTPGVRLKVAFEDPETEIAAILEGMYAKMKEYWDKPGLYQGPIGPGRPTLTWPQKAALTMLQRHMRWSYRDIEQYTKLYPGILAAVGVTQSKSHVFFLRSARAVTKFARKQKKLIGQSLPPGTPAAAA